MNEGGTKGRIEKLAQGAFTIQKESSASSSSLMNSNLLLVGDKSVFGMKWCAPVR
jgi:hypothetical protein